jgi:lipoyl(octanoyl) transferase
METLAVKELPWTWLGERPYRRVWELQESIRKAILAGKLRGHLLMMEHPPTVSLGRGERGANLLLDRETLEKQGFDVVETNRGGLVTYHGPGQLVAYPVVDLRLFRMGVRQYVHALEETMIRTLARFGLAACRKEGAIGAWLGPRKIGSIGIHVRKQVSIHGLALNLRTKLSHFNVMTPCGLTGVAMTSLLNEGKDVPLDEAVNAFAGVFAGVFGVKLMRTEKEPLYV